jgi:uncharacterized protein with HEPN domain
VSRADAERIDDIIEAATEPEVPWPDVIGLRTVLAHHYHRVDPDQLWTIAVNDIPELLDRLRTSRR